MRFAPVTPPAELTEKQWQQQVVDLAKQLGWHRPYHAHDSRRSEPGWPDLALVRDRFVLVELKREGGKLSDAQKQWIRRLHAAGVETYVARPSDLEALAAVLTGRKHSVDDAPAQLIGRARQAARWLHDATAKEAAT